MYKCLGFICFASVIAACSSSASGQLLGLRNRNCNQGSSRLVCGLPNYDYQSRQPVISALPITGYASRRIRLTNSLSTANAAKLKERLLADSVFELSSPIDAAELGARGSLQIEKPESGELVATRSRKESLSFRFPGGGSSLNSGIGRISLSRVGAELSPAGEFMFSGQLTHEGVANALLRSPLVTVSVEVIGALSAERDVLVDEKVLLVKSEEFRPRTGLAKTVLIKFTDETEKEWLRNHYGEVTHVRVKLAYLPER